MKELSHNIRLNEQQVVHFSIVQAIDDTGYSLVPEKTIAEANLSALNTGNDADFLKKRTAYLYDKLPASIKSWTKFALLPKDWLNIVIIVSFFTGLFSNYLGTEKSIHVVYNPITILIIWNIFIYVLYIFKGFNHLKLHPWKFGVKIKRENYLQETRKKTPLIRRILLDGLMGSLYRKSFSIHFFHEDQDIDLKAAKASLIRFWVILKNQNKHNLLNRFSSLLNAGAAGIALGALIGTYIRGVFFNYNVVWESTFLTDTGLITTLVNILYGPASLIFEGGFIPRETVLALTRPEGISAAPWIHKLSFNVFLIILVPRTILSLLFAFRAKHRKTAIDLRQPYFEKVLKHTREHMIQTIQQGIENIVYQKIHLLAENLAKFVRQEYFDKYIAGRLNSFKNNGGKICDIEADLNQYQEKFRPILQEQLDGEQNTFRSAVQKDIEELIGKEFNVDVRQLNKQHTRHMKLDHELTGQMARDIGDTMGTTVTAAVATAIGTISGGIGHSLGIAIISSVLGVSGPIGLLIGGIGTAVAMGSAYKLLRKKVTDSIKKVYLPAIVVSKTLSGKKIDKARTEIYDSIKSETVQMLEPQIEQLSNAILIKLTENLNK